MNNKTIELLELVRQNPNLPIKFMVNYKVVAGDDHEYWSADLGRVCVDEIYNGGTFSYGNEETVYVRSEDKEELVEHIAEYGFPRDDNMSVDKAYSIAEDIFEKLKWEKCILIYVEI